MVSGPADRTSPENFPENAALFTAAPRSDSGLQIPVPDCHLIKSVLRCGQSGESCMAAFPEPAHAGQIPLPFSFIKNRGCRSTPIPEKRKGIPNTACRNALAHLHLPYSNRSQKSSVIFNFNKFYKKFQKSEVRLFNSPIRTQIIVNFPSV